MVSAQGPTARCDLANGELAQTELLLQLNHANETSLHVIARFSHIGRVPGHMGAVDQDAPARLFVNESGQPSVFGDAELEDAVEAVAVVLED